jgi:chromosome segregation ATPase
LEDIPLPRQLAANAIVDNVIDPDEWKSIAEQAIGDPESWDRDSNSKLNGKGLFRWDVKLSRCMTKKDCTQYDDCAECDTLRKELKECHRQLAQHKKGGDDGAVMLAHSLQNRLVDMNEEREYALRKVERANRKMDDMREKYERSEKVISALKSALRDTDPDSAIHTIRTALDVPEDVEPALTESVVEPTLTESVVESVDEPTLTESVVEPTLTESVVESAPAETVRKPVDSKKKAAAIIKKKASESVSMRKATETALENLERELEQSSSNLPDDRREVISKIRDDIKALKKNKRKRRADVEKEVKQIESRIEEAGLGRQLATGIAKVFGTFLAESAKGAMRAVLPVAGEVIGSSAVGLIGAVKTVKDWYFSQPPAEISKGKVNALLKKYKADIKPLSGREKLIWADAKKTHLNPESVEAIKILYEQGWLPEPGDDLTPTPKEMAKTKKAAEKLASKYPVKQFTGFAQPTPSVAPTPTVPPGDVYLREAKTKAETENASLKASIERLTAENTALRSSVAELTSSGGLKEKVAELGAQVAHESEKGVLKARIAELESRSEGVSRGEVDNLRSQLEDARLENRRLKATISDLESRKPEGVSRENINKGLDRLQRDQQEFIRNIREDISNITAKFPGADTSDIMHKLNRCVDECSTDKQRLNDRIARMTQEYESRLRECEAPRGEIDSLRRQLDEYKKVNEQLRQTQTPVSGEFDEGIKELEARLAGLSAPVAVKVECEVELQKLERQYSLMKSEADKIVDDLRTQLIRKNQEVEDLHKQRAEVTGSQLEHQWDQCKKELDGLKNEHTRTRESLIGLQAKLEKMPPDTCEGELRACRESLQRYEHTGAQLDAARVEVESLTSLIQQHDTERIALRSRVEQLEADVRSGVDQIQQKDVEISRVNNELAACKQDLVNSTTTLEHEKRRLEDELKTITNQLGEVRFGFNQVTSELNTRNAELDVLKIELRTLTELNRELEGVKDSYENIKSQLNACNQLLQTSKVSEDAISKCTAEIQALTRQLNDSKRKLGASVQVKEGIQAQLAELQKKLSEVQGNLVESNNKLNQKQRELDDCTRGKDVKSTEGGTRRTEIDGSGSATSTDRRKRETTGNPTSTDITR